MSVLSDIIREREEWSNKNKFSNRLISFINKLELWALFGIAIFLFVEKFELLKI